MDKRRRFGKLGLYILLCLVSFSTQGNNRAKRESRSKELFPLFWGTNINNLQTSQTLRQGDLQLRIFHRFGAISDGASEMFGIYSPSNITMGLAYGVTSNFSVIFDAEKEKRFYDLSLKYRILTQKSDNSMPLSLTYILTTSYSGMGEENYGVTYHAANRWSYLNQVVAEKQIGYKTNVMAGIYYAHHNAALPKQPHDAGAFSLAMGYRLMKKLGLFATYQHNFALGSLAGENKRTEIGKDGFSTGISYGTPTHKFQFFVSNQYGINTGENIANNPYDISMDNLRIGFNISVRLHHKK
ncbi:DUF5777 family beta-barrel protein [Halosquirtibacter xylanolyticus]|uniref:DUF5777 family beta-barrel protein n=1 Tax=Halosquirtibacter xylanolyticus TaxID=3374599 RepID=UPI003749AF84|nr:DUF5777 family beta-barrel protein [Prolixibacteraceae bacterium]